MFGKYFVHIFKSPWDDNNINDNIFTRPRRNKPNFSNLQFNFSPIFIVIGLGVVLGLWLISGIYEVKEGEEAAVIRFGKFVRKGTPGLNYHLPSPIENTIIEKVNQSRRIEIGYRSSGGSRTGSDNFRGIASESIMLTGDENIIDLNCDVMWHIKDLEKFIFFIDGPEETVKAAVESALRDVIGNAPIISILSSQKQEITTKVEDLTQKILDNYNAGVTIEKVQLLKAEPPVEVIDAYRDVQTAKADKEREMNQAQAYSNDILPKARGKADKLIQEANGYKTEVIEKAQGDSKRFTAIYQEYSTNKQLTRDRLYLETVEKIFDGSNKVIIGVEGVLPHLSLDSNLKLNLNSKVKSNE